MLRGQHSTGYYEASSHGRTDKLIKEPADFSAFSYEHMQPRLKAKDKILDNISSDIFMGHNRFATVGAVNEMNAQPFKINNTVLAHNGTLVDRKYLQDKNISDSFFFTMDVEEKGLSHVLKNLDKASAYAISMWDNKEKKLSFSRNFQRPLYFAVNQDRNVLYWTSERDALALVLGRCGIHYMGWKKNAEDKNEQYGGIHQFIPGFIYECSIMDIRPRANIFKVVDKTIWWDADTKTYIHAKDLIDAENNKKEEDGEEKLIFTRRQAIIKARTEEVKNTVVPFSPPYKPVDLTKGGGKQLHALCGSCGRKLSVFEQYQIRNEKVSGYYQTSTGVYHCKCVGAGATKESVQVH